MRAIKFRAWDKKFNKMFDVVEISYEGDNLLAWREPYNKERVSWTKSGLKVGEECDLMQFTGLKDSNMKSICEGDIVRITYDTTWAEKPFYFGVVEYLINEDYPAFDLRPWIDCEMNALSWLKSESDPSVIKYEVVGNIFENPELLN